MDAAKTIDKLNDILCWEWTGLAQYAQAGFVVSGIWREVYSKMFLDSADECFGHAKLIGDKIVALGGVPSVERSPIRQSGNLEEMLQFSLEFEAGAVEHYKEALDIAEGDRALVVLLEDILLQEQEGVDELTKLLREQGAAGQQGGASASKAG